MTEKGTLINVDGIGNRVDCDCPERMCKITPILDWPLPGREYHLVLADDIVGIWRKKERETSLFYHKFGKRN